MLFTVRGNTTFTLEVVADTEEEAKKLALILLRQGMAELSTPLMVNVVAKEERPSSKRGG